jgi:hypothetical protein
LFTTLILIQIAREHQYAKCLGRWRRSILPFHAILPLPSRHGTAAWQSHSSRGAVSSIASAVMLTAKGLVVARRLLLYSYGAIVLATESRCAALATPVLAPKTVPLSAFRCLKLKGINHCFWLKSQHYHYSLLHITLESTLKNSAAFCLLE